MEEHTIHRLHEFVPHMARLQPDLVSLLPEGDRPGPGMDLARWVLVMPQKRLMEICTVWVLESLRRLRERSPLTNVLLRGCLALEGEFDLGDAGAIATGESIGPESPRREEIRRALNRAARAGLLIHLPSVDRYCIPFPVRLSFEGVDYLSDLEGETVRLRMVRHFARVAEEAGEGSEIGESRHWRFGNLVAALETASDLAEELLGIDGADWVARWEELREIPSDLAGPIVSLARLLGRALVTRQSDGGERLFALAVAAAGHTGDRPLQARFLGLMGQYHLRRGSHQRAHRAFRRCEAVFSTARLWREAILAATAQAMSLRESGHLRRAIPEFLRAGAIARHRALHNMELDNANCAASLMLELGEAEEAAALLRGLTAEDITPKYPPRAETLLLYGISLLRIGRLDRARPRLFSAIAEARAFGHRPVEARACLEISRVFETDGDHGEALKWVRRADALFADLADNAGQGRCALLLHRLLHRHPDDDYTSANQLLRRALRFSQAARDHSLEADIWLALLEGGESGETVESDIVLRCRQIDALRGTWRRTELVDALLSLSGAYERRGAYLSSASEALRAQAIARSTGSDDEIFRADRRLANLLPRLSHEELDYLSEEISDELESGKLYRQPVPWTPEG